MDRAGGGEAYGGDVKACLTGRSGEGEPAGVLVHHVS